LADVSINSKNGFGVFYLLKGTLNIAGSFKWFASDFYYVKMGNLIVSRLEKFPWRRNSKGTFWKLLFRERAREF